MAVAVRSTTAATGYSLTCTKPSGTASGDMLIAWFMAESSTAHTAGTSGFTQLTQGTWAGGAWRQSVWYRLAGGSEAASYTFGGPSGGSSIVSMYCVSGGDGATPTAATKNTGSSTAPASNSLTTTVDGAILIWLCSSSGNAITRPSGMTEGPHPGFATGDLDGASVTQTTAGAVTKTGTIGASVDWVVDFVAIQAPASGTPTIAEYQGVSGIPRAYQFRRGAVAY